VTGCVHLVGAGPGDPELLTVRAARLLGAADVVVHDRLVGPGVLELCRPGAELIDVSKRPGVDAPAQDEINELLIARARAGRDVVRLKGGDPLVFARGAEEAGALAAAGVPFDVVPGISSALAAPAAAGIAVTHRDIARSLVIVTGHARALDDQDWPALAAADTLVVLMGAATASELCARLIAGGRPPDTPAAAVQDATLPSQRDVRSTLADLPEAVAEAGLLAPLVLVIGAVAALDLRHALLEALA
jgi:uroporphyrin-III C-methyltransferase